MSVPLSRNHQPIQPQDLANEDSEINRRLTEHLRANAVRVENTGDKNDDAIKSNPFKQTFALVATIGLMIVSYFYTALFDRAAR